MSDLTRFESSIGFLGAGNMAAALVRGMVTAGLPPSLLTLCDVVPERSRALAAEVRAQAVGTSGELVAAASIVFIAVKPGSIPELLGQLGGATAGKSFISIAAGVTTQSLEAGLGAEARVVRAMPNTPALVGAGATGLAAGRFATEADLAQAKTLLAAVGTVEIVPER